MVSAVTRTGTMRWGPQMNSTVGTCDCGTVWLELLVEADRPSPELLIEAETPPISLAPRSRA